MDVSKCTKFGAGIRKFKLFLLFESRPLSRDEVLIPLRPVPDHTIIQGNISVLWISINRNYVVKFFFFFFSLV